MSLPLLLGEAPGSSGATNDPLGAKTARRLCEFAGWPPAEGFDPFRAALAARFELRNLLDFNPGKNGKGMCFPFAEARAAAAELDLVDRHVVVLGKRVALALGLERPTYFEWTFVRGARELVVIPHPSGINRNYNDPAMRERAGQALREAAEPRKGGERWATQNGMTAKTSARTTTSSRD